MELKEIKDQLMKWVDGIKYAGYKEKDCIYVDEKNEKVHLMFYTNDHSYSIIAKSSYLGCIGSSRKSRTGENWTRGNDLPDGLFCYETWIKILKGIIGYELVKIQRSLSLRYQKEKREDGIREDGIREEG